MTEQEVWQVLSEISECATLQYHFLKRCEQLQSMSLDDMLRSNRLKDNFLHDGWTWLYNYDSRLMSVRNFLDGLERKEG